MQHEPSDRTMYQYCEFSVSEAYPPFIALAGVPSVEMTEAFTAGVMIFIEQFRTRWPWSIGV